MNVTAKAIHQQSILTGIRLRTWVLSKTSLVMATLITTILLSALSLIYVKERGRTLLSEITRLQYMQDNLQVRHSQLLLEGNTLMAQARLKIIAESKLQMEIPKATKLISSSLV